MKYFLIVLWFTQGAALKGTFETENACIAAAGEHQIIWTEHYRALCVQSNNGEVVAEYRYYPPEQPR